MECMEAGSVTCESRLAFDAEHMLPCKVINGTFTLRVNVLVAERAMQPVVLAMCHARSQYHGSCSIRACNLCMRHARQHGCTLLVTRACCR